MAIQISRDTGGFSSWAELLALLQDAFAYMEHRIDPPSSLLRMTVQSIVEKSLQETLFLARADEDLVGCVFVREQDQSFYVGKLAVTPSHQGNGIGRRLMDAVDTHARESGTDQLELDTRIELVENHQTFAAMGYVKTAEHAHEGYDRPTFIRMSKRLGPATEPDASRATN